MKKIIENKIIEIINQALSQNNVKNDFEISLTTPPKIELGDFAFGCFPLAKILGKSPMEIAEDLVGKIKIVDDGEFIESVQSAGPYVNIKMKRYKLFGEVYREMFKRSVVADGSKNIMKKNGQRIMIEYLSPNTNKPLHLGHMRNGTLGMAVANILEKNGDKVVKAELINDRGVHICKSMLAWKLFANGETPETAEMKSDHFVGKYYVRFAKEVEKNPELEERAQEMLKKWEEGDEEVLKLWRMMNQWVFNGFEESFKTLGFEFDKVYRESETYKLGKDIIEKGLEKGVFKKTKEGAVVFILPDSFGLEKNGDNKIITVLRADGTSVYVTQDLGTAVLKAEEYNLDQSVYVVASEQDYYFKSLFEILKALEYKWADKSYHLSYGMVYLPDGRMKSREGKVVDADNLVEEISKLAKVGITERQGDKSIPDEEMERRAQIIALGAIKFYLLKVNPKQDITFNSEESLSFEGFTGPYCQYSYARGSKLLRDSQTKADEKIEADFSVLGSEEELQLLHKILEVDEKLKLAGENFNSSTLAVHIFELAKTFNQFYHSETILQAEEKTKFARLSLVQMFLKTIKSELSLLGIDVLEEM